MGGAGSGRPSVTCGARTRSGGQCKRPPMVGLHRCKNHFGGSDKAKEQHALAKMRSGLAKLVSPVAEDDPEVNPFYGYPMEIRRTLGAIRYYEEKIAQLREDEAFWGKSKESRVDAAEFPGVNVDYEAKTNSYIAAWERERAHLTDLHKLWITAKMDERRLQAETTLIDSLDQIVTAVVVGLHQDPRSPEVRDVVRRAMMGLSGHTPAIEAV